MLFALGQLVCPLLMSLALLLLRATDLCHLLLWPDLCAASLLNGIRCSPSTCFPLWPSGFVLIPVSSLSVISFQNIFFFSAGPPQRAALTSPHISQLVIDFSHWTFAGSSLIYVFRWPFYLREAPAATLLAWICKLSMRLMALCARHWLMTNIKTTVLPFFLELEHLNSRSICIYIYYL